MHLLYEVHSTIIFPGSRVSDFSGNLRAQKLNKSQTKRSNRTGAQHNSRGQQGVVSTLCYPFLFQFIFVLITTFFPSPWRLPAVAAAAVCRWNIVSDTYGQDTVVASAIPRPIRWLVHLFFGCSFSAGDGYGSIEASLDVLPSETL